MVSSTPIPVLDWPTDPNQYELIRKIGQGAFASVWRARRRPYPQPQPLPQQDEGGDADDTPTTAATTSSAQEQECAVKMLNLDHVNSNLDQIRLEVQAMRLSSHPNILACHAAFINDIFLWAVTPLMRKGSSIHCLETARRQLRQQQQQQQQSPMQQPEPSLLAMEDHILYILYETLLGLQYIHDNGQIHRDIKASNILLDGTAEVKIADFGVCSFLIHSGWSQQTKAKTFVGTPCWMAPEVMEQVHGYDYKADIWSLGITALELAMGVAPYAHFPPMKVLVLTIQSEPPSLETYRQLDGVDNTSLIQYFSSSFQELVQLCLQKNPAQRPLCQDLLRSSYFEQFANYPTYRQDRRHAMKKQVCSLVEDVGEESVMAPSTPTAGHHSNEPPERDDALTQRQQPHSSSQPSQQQQQQQQQQEPLSEQNDRPADTTWIFPEEGSQILSASSEPPRELDEVLEELDEFGRLTGGENYVTRMEQQEQREQQEHNDDIDDFLSEFEKITAGEDFRRQP